MRYGKRDFGFKRRRVLLAISLLLLGIGGAGLAFQHLAPESFIFNPKGPAFDAGFDMSYEDGQKIYKEAGEALGNRRPEDALALYAKIRDRYKRLRPVIMLHEAQAYADLNQEDKAQETLQHLTGDYRNTALAKMGWYKLGQSCARTQSTECAKEAFEHVIGDGKDKTDLSVASNYYLGELADAAGDKDAAARRYEAYLSESQDGTFSTLAAQGLDKAHPQKTPDDHYLMGMAYFNQQSWQKARYHLEHASFGKAWVALGKAYYHSGDTPRAIQTFEKGLHVTCPSQQAEDGLKAMLSLIPTSQQKIAKLQQIQKTHPKSGGDYILWQLGRLNEGQSRLGYDQQLVSGYGSSNWAPESSWELIWNDYKTGHSAAFMERADNHLSRYPNSLSAPRVMFWKAKVFLNQQKHDLANALFERLVKEYPHQYYAYRAQQILDGVSSPWHTSPSHSYPPDGGKKASPEVIAKYAEDPALESVIAELFKIHSPDEVPDLLQTRFRSPGPAPILSMVYHQDERYPQSLRTMRDFLDEQRKLGKYPTEPDVYKLLYPIVYSSPITQWAQKNRLDPYLVQALMRQESYFNPVAISSSRAMGLMQLLPSTAQGVAQWEKMGGFQPATLFTPDVNVHLGTRYLRYLHDTFNGNSMMSVGGYNGGPGAMGRWTKTHAALLAKDPDMFVENIPYSQSRDYIKEVFSHYWNYLELYQPG